MRRYAKSRKTYTKRSVSNSARSAQIAKRRGQRNSRKAARSFKRNIRRSKRIRKRVQVHIPREGVKETFFQNSFTKSMKYKAKKMAMVSGNFYAPGPVGTKLTCQSGVQNWQQFQLFTRNTMATALTATGMAPSNSTGSRLDTNKTFFKYARKNLVLTNNSTGPAAVDILHFVCKRDCNQDIPTLWLAGMQDAQGSTTDNRIIYGNNPLISPALNQYWKLKERTDYTIGPGGTLRHNWVENMYSTISNELIATDVNTNSYLAGKTQAILILFRGMPGTDGTTTSLVNTTPVVLDVVTTDEYHFTYLADNDTNLYITGSSGMGTVGGNVNIYNANGGLGADFETAAVS